MKKISLIYLLITFLIHSALFAQTNSGVELPEIGKPMPDFVLDRITHFKTNKATLKDFRGKWLFLDFWFTGCHSCIASFPHVNEKQKKFKDHIQYVLVGLNGYSQFGAKIEDLYERLSKRQNLNIASAYDSVLVKRWEIYGMPHIFVIDPEGIVRAISSGGDLTSEKIQQLIDGKHPFIRDKRKRPEFDEEFFSNDATADTNILFRSILKKVSREEPSYFGTGKIDTRINNDYYKIKGYKAQGADLRFLYFVAYIGEPPIWQAKDSMYKTMYPFPVLEVKDSNFFKVNEKELTGYYDYSLFIPSKNMTKENLMQAMQNDLKNHFGYVVSFERRNMPIWKLIAKPGSADKLKTRGGKPSMYSSGSAKGGNDASGANILKWVNVDAKLLLSVIRSHISNGQPPFFDETGLTGNIDITIDALMTDRESIRKELQRNGLDLVKGEREFTVMVIRDPAKKSSGQVIQTN